MTTTFSTITIASIRKDCLVENHNQDLPDSQFDKKLIHIGGYSPEFDAQSKYTADMNETTNFSVMGPWYGKLKDYQKHARLAAANGKSVAIHIGAPPSLMKLPFNMHLAKRKSLISELTDAEISNSIEAYLDEVLEEIKPNELICCWFVNPEELRPWVKEEMRYLRLLTKTIRKRKHTRRKIMMYEPNNRNSTQMTTVSMITKTVVRGAYLSQYKSDVVRLSALNSAIAETTATANKTNSCSYIVLELYNDISQELLRGRDTGLNEQELTENLIYHDIWYSFLKGIDGIHIWSLYHRRPNLNDYARLRKSYELASASIAQHAEYFIAGSSKLDLKIHLTDRKNRQSNAAHGQAQSHKLQKTPIKSRLTKKIQSDIATAHASAYETKSSRLTVFINSLSRWQTLRVETFSKKALCTMKSIAATEPFVAELADHRGFFSVNIEPFGTHTFETPVQCSSKTH